jgi:hypothetical protein
VVDDASSATISIAAIIGLSIALISGAADVVTVLGFEDLDRASTLISGTVGVLMTCGILSAGGLGLLSPRKMRRIPLMDLKASRSIDPRSLRKSRI